jgi:uncharacterized Fe-S radical SAM superfamily protein PflX
MLGVAIWQGSEAPRHRVNVVVPIKEHEGTRTEVLIETFIRKQLHLKAHIVTKVEETDENMLVYIDRLGKRLLRCGVCRQRCLEVHDIRKQRAGCNVSVTTLDSQSLESGRSHWRQRSPWPPPSVLDTAFSSHLC